MIALVEAGRLAGQARTVLARRDDVIRKADRAGATWEQIAEVTCLPLATIANIVGREADKEQARLARDSVEVFRKWWAENGTGASWYSAFVAGARWAVTPPPDSVEP